jgi:hypothetical protein
MRESRNGNQYVIQTNQAASLLWATVAFAYENGHRFVEKGRLPALLVFKGIPALPTVISNHV